MHAALAVAFPIPSRPSLVPKRGSYPAYQRHLGNAKTLPDSQPQATNRDKPNSSNRGASSSTCPHTRWHFCSICRSSSRISINLTATAAQHHPSSCGQHKPAFISPPPPDCMENNPRHEAESSSSTTCVTSQAVNPNAHCSALLVLFFNSLGVVHSSQCQ